MNKVSILIFIILIGLKLPSSAQQALWHSIGVEQGLPDPNVTAFIKAENHLLYVGTAVGLFSYDGYNFTKIELGHSKRMNPYINCLVQEGKLIYIGLRDALIRYNSGDHSIQTIHNPLNSIGGIISMTLDTLGHRLYARTHKGTLLVDLESGNFSATDSLMNPMLWKFRIINRLKIQTFTLQKQFLEISNHHEKFRYEDKQILDAEWWDREKCWLVVKKEGLFSLDSSLVVMKRIDLPAPLNEMENKWFYPDRGGNIWLQAKGGFYCLHSLNGNAPQFFSHESGNPFTITSNTAQAFFTELDGTYWVGGDGTGISYLTPEIAKIKYFSNQQAGVQHFWCFRHEKKSGKLLCGTTSGILEGTLANGRYENWKSYKPDGFDRFSVNAFVDMNEQEYLISVFKAGLWTFNKHTKEFRPMSKINKEIGTLFDFGIKEISDNRLALCTQNSVWILDKKTLKINRLHQPIYNNYSIYTLIEDSTKRFLIAGGFGLQIFDSQLKEISHFTTNQDSTSLPSNVIFDLYECKQGKYLLATMGAGLCLFDEHRKHFQSIRLATNPSNVFGILPTSQNTYVLTTSNGLCRYNSASGKSVMLNNSNFLPFNDFNQSAFYQDADYTMVGGEKGMLLLQSSELNSVFDRQIGLIIRAKDQIPESLVLEPSEHSIQVQLCLEKILPTSQLKYKHRITGIDIDWLTMPPGQNSLIYNYLPPGKYLLEVMLNDETELYQTSKKSIPLIVKPHFYQTVWFNFIAWLFSIGLIFFIARHFSMLRLRWKLNRLDAERKIMLERSRISRELHDNLGSQLTYMISGLETTDLLLKRNKIERTAQNLENLQEAARESMQQLRDSIWALNPGAMTLKSLANQYEKWLMKVTEPNEQLSCSFTNNGCSDQDVDPITGLNIFRIMQEAVHNVLKHSGATQLTTTMICDDNTLKITISDNGKGIEKIKAEGNGLSSMKQRAAAMNASLSIASSPATGTKVIMVLAKNRLKD